MAFFQLFSGPTNATFSSGLLLGVVDPADELVACQGSDVDPGGERRRAGDERLSEIGRKLVDHSTGHSFAAHDRDITGLAVAGSAGERVGDVDSDQGGSRADERGRAHKVRLYSIACPMGRSQQSAVSSSAMVPESEVSAQ